MSTYGLNKLIRDINRSPAVREDTSTIKFPFLIATLCRLTSGKHYAVLISGNCTGWAFTG